MTESADAVSMAALAAALRGLQIPFYIGGSVASSSFGRRRSTADTDIVAEIRAEHVDRLVAMLQDDFYIDAMMIHDAIRRRSSFNVIHLDSAHKIDVFIPKLRSFDHSVAMRAEPSAVFEDDPREYPVASAEDVVLNKLEWYRTGGEVSERQWLDVIWVMKVQRDHLDQPYLSRWAAELGVSDLLDRAWREVEGGGS